MADIDPIPFKDLLRRYRVAAGLTQKALAERAGLSIRTISDLERGVNDTPRKDTLPPLLRALDLSPQESAALRTAARRGARRVAPPRIQQRPPHNVPAQTTPLIGREREAARVQALLRRADVRLLTLTGPGGIGKTRLALHVAAAALDHFSGGVFVVALAALTDPAQVEPAIARALTDAGIVAPDPCASVAAALRDAPALLLLDNTEHLPPAAALVAELLAACPMLTILATGRSALRVHGEHRLPVPPLSLPDPDCPPGAAFLCGYEAVRLFVARAQAAMPDVALTDANAAAIAAICRRLDGLPLAIELAAARSAILPPRALLARLERPGEHGHAPLQVLTGGASDVPARQRTLHDTIAWSYDLLDASEQALFRRLAVFAGGTLAAIETVCAEDGAAPDALEGVSSLVDKSLLQVVTDDGVRGEADERHFTLLETIRAYALRLLAASGEGEALRRRHAAYYVALAEEIEPELMGPRQASSLARLEREHDNLRAALRWARECGDRTIGLRLGAALWRFWWTRGYLAEGRRWLDAFLGLAPGAEGLDPVRARALGAAGVLAAIAGAYDRATTLLDEALALRRALGDERGIAVTLGNLGGVAMKMGDYGRADRLFAEDLAARRALGDMWGIASALNNLAELARLRGDYQGAIARAAESMTFYERVGDASGVANVLHIQGGAALRQGAYDRAAAAFTRGLDLARAVGDKSDEADCPEGLAAVATGQTQSEHAVQLYGVAARLRDKGGLPLPPVDQTDYERAVSDARAARGNDRFAVAWAKGVGAHDAEGAPLDGIIAAVRKQTIHD